MLSTGLGSILRGASYCCAKLTADCSRRKESMTRLTAMIIQSRGDDIVCSAATGPAKDNGKWAG